MARRMVELALSAFRTRVSPQTGFIHLFLENPLDLRQDTIPLYENFLYVHALFCSRIAQNIQDGKALLEKLLAFEVDGNFPIYLHEYPTCLDPKLSAHILVPLHYLLQDFRSILLEILEPLLARILKHLTALPESPFLTNRIAAHKGQFFESNWDSKGPSEWAEYCLCAQMAGAPLSRASDVWDVERAVFTGKAKERLQEGFEPAVTLFDLFMGELYQSFSARALAESLVHLEAALVYPMETERAPLPKPFVALLEEGKRQCLTLYTANEGKTYSLTLESKKGSWTLQETASGVFSCTYAYEELLPLEEESVEFALFLSALEGVFILINGQKGTVFSPGDMLDLTMPPLQVKLSIQGEGGEWTGHISKSNRSFQKAQTTYFAYDWKIGFRTLRRSAQATAKVTIQLN